MVGLQDEKYSKAAETMRILGQHPRFSSELAVEIRKPGGGDRAVDAMLGEFFPPEPKAPLQPDPVPGSCLRELPPERFRLTVTYGAIPSATALRKQFDIVEFGDYPNNDWACDGWHNEKRLPKGKKNMLVRSYGVRMKSEEVMRQALRKGYRLGFLNDGLELAEACPDFQRRCNVVVLGSTIILKSRSVAVLCGDASSRKLSMMPYDTLWEPYHHFLLVEDEERNVDPDVEKLLKNFPPRT